MKLNFCTECAAPLHQQTATEYVCDNSHPYYNNPRATCIVVLMNEKKELLYAQRANEPQKGKYGFPGGFLNFGEDSYEGITREAKEELNIDLLSENLELIDSSSHLYVDNESVCDFVFLCHHWHGSPQAGDDAAALAWKPLEFLKSKEFAWSYPHLYDKLQKVLT